MQKPSRAVNGFNQQFSFILIGVEGEEEKVGIPSAIKRLAPASGTSESISLKKNLSAVCLSLKHWQSRAEASHQIKLFNARRSARNFCLNFNDLAKSLNILTGFSVIFAAALLEECSAAICGLKTFQRTARNKIWKELLDVISIIFA